MLYHPVALEILALAGSLLSAAHAYPNQPDRGRQDAPPRQRLYPPHRTGAGHRGPRPEPARGRPPSRPEAELQPDRRRPKSPGRRRGLLRRPAHQPTVGYRPAKIKGATAKVTLSALNNFLHNALRTGVELLKDTHPEVYQSLREASQVDDARYGKDGKETAHGRGKTSSCQWRGDR